LPSGRDLHDGAERVAELIDVNGTLFGSTWFGGEYDKGTLYSVALLKN